MMHAGIYTVKQWVMEEELNRIDGLLQDKSFAMVMAEALHDAYNEITGEPTTAFIKPGEEHEVIVVSAKSEKIAINLAGFYALECGIGALAAQTDQTRVALLQTIVDRKLDKQNWLLLKRFANATWKAGQPFREINRITRPNFIGASHLTREDIEKDEVQIINAATKLLASLTETNNDDVQAQMEQLRSLLQDPNYAVEMAAWLHACYYTGQQQNPPPFLTNDDELDTVTKPVREIRIATNMAGFYAVESGINFLATSRGQLPSTTLKQLVDNTISDEDKILFARFANATWKAGQPFLELSRITKEIFTPFYFLNEEDIKKDLVQVIKSAKILLKELKK